jgi:hypothetical protein
MKAAMEQADVLWHVLHKDGEYSVIGAINAE